MARQDIWEQLSTRTSYRNVNLDRRATRYCAVVFIPRVMIRVHWVKITLITVDCHVFISDV